MAADCAHAGATCAHAGAACAHERVACAHAGAACANAGAACAHAGAACAHAGAVFAYAGLAGNHKEEVTIHIRTCVLWKSLYKLLKRQLTLRTCAAAAVSDVARATDHRV